MIRYPVSCFQFVDNTFSTRRNYPRRFAYLLFNQTGFVVSMMICSFYSRTFLSIISGVVAGIWGFTGLTGFVFYFLIMLVASIGLLAKSKFSVHTYFDSWSRILVEGVLAGLMVSIVAIMSILWFTP
uniref:ER membrane protein complex subunit 6 n=1 Tax=Aegilops tauschii subsp. strangulata TaxID=200361 RepID=A0A452ZU48_AEGTS